MYKREKGDIKKKMREGEGHKGLIDIKDYRERKLKREQKEAKTKNIELNVKFFNSMSNENFIFF